LLGFVLAIFLAQVVFRLRFKLHELAMLFFAAYAACVHIRFCLDFRYFPGSHRSHHSSSVGSSLRPSQGSPRSKFHLLLRARARRTSEAFASNRDLDQMVAKDYPVRPWSTFDTIPSRPKCSNEYGGEATSSGSYQSIKCY